MDAYEYEKIDREMSKRIDTIYSDPSRHKFYSEYEHSVNQDMRGPRGGKIRGRKTFCRHCGNKANGHAAVDEQL